ncbi:hypothetical protein [Thiomicrorhabdus sp. Kp2]|uniref:hypothetical protein n=1 Tax=Thiomicrorhabdus sp. Kp2 TaxID=1123518 RepID=UPI0004045AE3|nr:hypothetical protein [Thiomicrorhabdus sp. Kp2]
MKMIGVIGVLSTFLLTACSSNGFLKDIKSQTVQLGKNVGLVEVNTIKKPDYYSTKQIEKSYEFGQYYDIHHLDCSGSSKPCE